MDICAWMPLKSPPERGYTSQYAFLAKRQHSKYAIVPVHTAEERKYFRDLLVQNPSNAVEPDWKQLSRVWCLKADGKSIFYKTPEHLRGYYNTWQEKNVAANSIALNLDSVQMMAAVLGNPSRLSVAPPPQVPSGVGLTLPSTNQLITGNIGSSEITPFPE